MDPTARQSTDQNQNQIKDKDSGEIDESVMKKLMNKDEEEEMDFEGLLDGESFQNIMDNLDLDEEEDIDDKVSYDDYQRGIGQNKI